MRRQKMSLNPTCSESTGLQLPLHEKTWKRRGHSPWFCRFRGRCGSAQRPSVVDSFSAVGCKVARRPYNALTPEGRVKGERVAEQFYTKQLSNGLTLLGQRMEGVSSLSMSLLVTAGAARSARRRGRGVGGERMDAPRRRPVGHAAAQQCARFAGLPARGAGPQRAPAFLGRTAWRNLTRSSAFIGRRAPGAASGGCDVRTCRQPAQGPRLAGG